jgi:hypothetical protein
MHGDPVQLLSWHHYAAVAGLIVFYIILAKMRILPSMAGFKDFTDTINSAGGHIIILSVFSFLSIRVAIHYIFFVMNLPGDTITKSQATIAVGMSFVTGGLAGTFIGALLKTMSGGKANGGNGTPDAITAGFSPAEKK